MTFRAARYTPSPEVGGVTVVALLPCVRCDYIRATFATRIAAGEHFRCSVCGAVHGVGGGGPVTGHASEVGGRHVDDVRAKVFWTAVAVTLLLAPSPALLTQLVGSPRAGLEHAITLWHVFLHTLPLTLAVAVDAGVLLWYRRHPEHYPATRKGETTLWCLFGGVPVGSMVIGNWLGGVELSEWSRDRLGGRGAEQQARNGARALVGGAVQNNAMIPVAVAVGAAAAVANYFTLYGPGLFLSSLAVGTLLGWLWAIKLPDVLAELDAAGSAGR